MEKELAEVPYYFSRKIKHLVINIFFANANKNRRKQRVQAVQRMQIIGFLAAAFKIFSHTDIQTLCTVVRTYSSASSRYGKVRYWPVRGRLGAERLDAERLCAGIISAWTFKRHYFKKVF